KNQSSGNSDSSIHHEWHLAGEVSQKESGLHYDDRAGCAIRAGTGSGVHVPTASDKRSVTQTFPEAATQLLGRQAWNAGTVAAQESATQSPLTRTIFAKRT